MPVYKFCIWRHENFISQELSKLNTEKNKNQSVIDRGVFEEEQRLHAVRNIILQQELKLKEAGELLQSTTNEEIGLITTQHALILFNRREQKS